jgi:hypothetical protein
MVKRQLFSIALLAMLVGLPLHAAAQASAPVANTPTPPGVAPRIKPPPKLLTPAEKRAIPTSAIDNEARPEGAVKPQLNIRLGKTPPPPSAGEARAVRPANSATGIDDAAAACDAEIGPQARAACRAKRSQTDLPSKAR